MGTYMLTSLFPNGLCPWQARLFSDVITARKRFAFVASDFEGNYEKTDIFFHLILDLFVQADICFDSSRVVDGRITAAEAQEIVSCADVVWLAGGDTYAQFGSLVRYGLVNVIRCHEGVVIGMSAGTINLAKNAVLYDPPYGQTTAVFYSGLGAVDITADPHFEPKNVAEELLAASEKQPFYGLCDNSVILCRTNGDTEFYGEIYRVDHRCIERIN